MWLSILPTVLEKNNAGTTNAAHHGLYELPPWNDQHTSQNIQFSKRNLVDGESVLFIIEILLIIKSDKKLLYA